MNLIECIDLLIKYFREQINNENTQLSTELVIKYLNQQRQQINESSMSVPGLDVKCKEADLQKKIGSNPLPDFDQTPSCAQRNTGDTNTVGTNQKEQRLHRWSCHQRLPGSSSRKSSQTYDGLERTNCCRWSS